MRPELTPERWHLEIMFPSLRNSDYAVTSPADPRYNCIAWAAGFNDDWWDARNPDTFWPSGLPRGDTVDVVVGGLATVGYERCEDGLLEDGVEKVAIYASGEYFQHIARQLPSGKWTSKLGSQYDTEHELEALTSTANRGGPVQYGEVVAYMRRALDG